MRTISLRFLALICCLLFVCNKCKQEGVESLPELSHTIYNALKAKDFNKMKAVIPTGSSMAKYLELYDFNKNREPNARNEEGKKRALEMNTLLKKQFNQTLADGQARG